MEDAIDPTSRALTRGDQQRVLAIGYASDTGSPLLREGGGMDAGPHHQNHVGVNLPTVIRWSKRRTGTPRPWLDQHGQQPLVAAKPDSPGD